MHRRSCPVSRSGGSNDSACCCDCCNGFLIFYVYNIYATHCTHRGLDLPAVEHVIQAEFALNVVQHVHRNGRASRAGKLGRATMIFDDSSADLVQSVLSSGDDKRGIEQSFSRRRGFRRNLNRKARTRSPDR